MPRGQHIRLDVTVVTALVLGHDPRDRNLLEEREAVLAEVVIVVEPACLPTAVDPVDQLLLEGGTQIRSRFRGARQPLHLVAVVAAIEEVGDAANAEVVESVEYRTAAEVDEHRLVATTEDVTLPVAKPRDTCCDLLDGHLPSYV